MLRFEDPIYLWMLLIIPILVLVRFIVWQKRKRNLRKFGDPSLLKEMMPDVSKYRPTIKFCLLLSVITILIFMIARPQVGSKISHEKREGIEVLIALDISNSMLAQDVIPSRLEKSKLLIEDLVDHFTNDKVGLVVFAGDAFVQLPITNDYVSAKMFLQNINPSLITTQGTDLARAISLSQSCFTQREHIGRAIIVITDGEDHEGGALEAAREAYKKGINVFILGVGTSKGAPIPDGNGGYLKDNSGQTVLSALNEQMCQQVAKAGNGVYIHVDNTSDAQEKLNKELSKLQSGISDTVVYSEYNEQFQIFGIILLLLLIAETILLESRNPLFKKINLFRDK
ncbi:MAG: VWA domain-containing protein [Prevotella salivae]|jgi:batB protein|uniref:vWA domain-containing protein n=1 Tax=Segatella salivae TaxID=228604 RepID=UPI001CB54A95|nr:VWA domain-containing protein [Segatella salivae]MBF1521453.1 VWA domain-containing protein [Segatella salivae]